MEKEKWPDFFIVGAPRSGTTSFYEYLKVLPGIFMPEIKEPNYFSVSTDPKFFFKAIRDKQQYLDLFSDAKDEIIGEASPSYLRDPKAAQLIHDIVPNAKIIMALRDPLERTFSHYLQFHTLGTETISFSELIKKINNLEGEYSKRIFESGLYSKQVQRYLNIFGSNQVKVLIFEEFIEDVEKAVKEVLIFLGINAQLSTKVTNAYRSFPSLRMSFLRPVIRNNTVRTIAKKLSPRWRRILVEMSVTRGKPKPKLSNDDRLLLEEFYINDVLELEKILKRSLPWFHLNKGKH